MILILFLLGLVIGSFLGALSYRLPRNISISKGRSVCPNCKHIITWHDNIPLLSYILLFGKCRNCKKHISIRYPLIELFTALGFIIVGSTIQSSNFFDLFYYLIVFAILVLVFVVDFEEQIIPDEATFVVIVLSLFYL
ncbi:prepilin peptidase, partial [Candidatus Woesebacteria bacterium]|nr:prepilin peptidase [Candidatus Woesebacteria bacterium]